ncbi:unnamed protein product, partial [Linum tenue]
MAMITNGEEKGEWRRGSWRRWRRSMRGGGEERRAKAARKRRTKPRWVFIFYFC